MIKYSNPKLIQIPLYIYEILGINVTINVIKKLDKKMVF